MRKRLREILNLREGTDFEQTKATISEGVSLRGFNLWILLCSTVLASIGLDTNSTAVIIGAMLISPLMSPILGVGLSVAIHDKQLLFRSLRDLFFAVLISLSVSILYFLLSPLGAPTAELRARTFPTLLDVLIALFGGIAGIVSISRAKQTNALPGVAIATALMPPLCTAGFGIATANWKYFFGAFYLFFINAVFISLATYLIVRHLHFPEKEFTNAKVAKQYRRLFIALSILVLTPSIYLLYSVYKDELTKKEIQQFVLEPIKKHGNEILEWEVTNRGTLNFIKVYHAGKQLSDSLKNSIDSSLKTHQMGSYQLLSVRVNLTKEEVKVLSADMAKQMFQEMQLKELNEQGANNTAADTLTYFQIFKEAKIAFPYLDALINGRIVVPNAAQTMDTLTMVIYKTSKSITKTQTKLLYNFLCARFAKDTVVFIKK